MSKSLLKSTSVVSFMTLLSRVLGFVRDTVVAQMYGASAAVDAFLVAFKIPNFMRNLFAEGCFSQAFVPVLSEYRHQRSQEEVRAFISHVSAALGSVLLLITLLGFVGAPLLVMLFAPGYAQDSTRFVMATEMLRVTVPYLMLISLTAMAGAVLNNHGKFAVPAFTPVLLNVCMIAAALWFSHYFVIPVEAQAWSVLVAGCVQLAFQLPFLHRIGVLVKPQFRWRDEGVRRVLKLMVPALFGASIGQLSILINTIFASFLKVGSISWLYYSERLAYFPLGVFGVALATVVLPHLSRKHAERSSAQFSHALDWGIRCNLLIGIPATVALMVLAGPLIVSLFHYGKFTTYDVFMTRRSVLAYAFGLQAFMLVKVLAAGFYARQEITVPVRLGVIAIGLNIFLNAVLVFPLAHAGLALAAALASWINAGMLLWALYRRKIYQLQSGWGKFSAQLVFANAVTGLVLWWGAGDLSNWLQWHWQQRVIHICWLGIVALIMYLLSLALVGMRPRDFKAHE